MAKEQAKAWMCELLEQLAVHQRAGGHAISTQLVPYLLTIGGPGPQCNEYFQGLSHEP